MKDLEIEIKAKYFDALVDDYCEVYGVRDCIAMLRSHLGLSDADLIGMGFSENDL